MLASTLFISVLLVLGVKAYTVSDKTCTRITGTSGTIENKKTASHYSKCWSFSVPRNNEVQITMESFRSYLEECEYTRVEVSLDNNDETYAFCPMGRQQLQTFKEDFTLTHYLTQPYDVFTSQFSLKYEFKNPCLDDFNIECDDYGDCSTVFKCDDPEPCLGEADPTKCGDKTLMDPDLTESIVKGIRWLKDNWSYTTGWQENTHRGITALLLARNRNGKKVNVEEKLMVKQLQVQTLVYILRKEADKLSVNQLSMFVNALIISCENPHNFFGHNLVKMLKDEVESSSIINHSVAYLALCNAGETLPINVTNDLTEFLKTNAKYSFLLDVQAITVMALSCLNNEKGGNETFPQVDYEEAVRRFKDLQRDDGSFGNIYTTAVVTQALLSAGQKNSKDWQYNKAISYLTRHLNPASDDFLAMYLILPILNGKSLTHIRNTNCSGITQRDNLVDVKNKPGPKMRVQYSLNIGDEKDIVHTISLRVPENITVFEVMQLAQKADAKYKFQSKQMGEDQFIYDIAGIKNDFEDGRFWLLYVGKDTDSLRQENKSPDHVILQDGAHIVMWYKKAHI